MENTEKMIFPGVGKYGIPEIKPETDIRIDKLEWIPVNYALTANNKAVWRYF
nr:MAG TPA: delta endotoxin [Caudoviricetes sp.]